MTQEMENVKKMLKLKVFDLSNKLQIILGYFETKQYDKAIKACKAAKEDLHAVAAGLIALRRASHDGGRRAVDDVPVGQTIGQVATVLEHALDAVEEAVKEKKNGEK